MTRARLHVTLRAVLLLCLLPGCDSLTVVTTVHVDVKGETEGSRLIDRLEMVRCLASGNLRSGGPWRCRIQNRNEHGRIQRKLEVVVLRLQVVADRPTLVVALFKHLRRVRRSGRELTSLQDRLLLLAKSVIVLAPGKLVPRVAGWLHTAHPLQRVSELIHRETIGDVAHPSVGWLGHHAAWSSIE